MEIFQRLNIVPMAPKSHIYIQKRKSKPMIVSEVDGLPDVSLQDMFMINSICSFNIHYIYVVVLLLYCGFLVSIFD